MTTDNKTPVELWVDLIVRDVAELPDRTSPEEWPEAMIVTDEELRDILTERIGDLSRRAAGIKRDVLDNHLPRIADGLRAGYVDENQALVVFDHLVRVRAIESLFIDEPTHAN